MQGITATPKPPGGTMPTCTSYQAPQQLPPMPGCKDYEMSCKPGVHQYPLPKVTKPPKPQPGMKFAPMSKVQSLSRDIGTVILPGQTAALPTLGGFNNNQLSQMLMNWTGGNQGLMGSLLSMIYGDSLNSPFVAQSYTPAKQSICPTYAKDFQAEYTPPMPTPECPTDNAQNCKGAAYNLKKLCPLYTQQAGKPPPTQTPKTCATGYSYTPTCPSYQPQPPNPNCKDYDMGSWCATNVYQWGGSLGNSFGAGGTQTQLAGLVNLLRLSNLI